MEFEEITKQMLKEKIIDNVKLISRKTLATATNDQLYEALAFTIRDIVMDRWIETHKVYNEQDAKVTYYLSMEFLMGRFLGNAIINLTMDENVREALTELGLDYNQIEDSERDPGLGNGGLGRLAACFLDSLSTLSLPAYGCGIRYRYGIFEQRIEKGYQVEKPDNWLALGDYWGVKRQEYAVDVEFGGTVRSFKKENSHYSFKTENAQTISAIPYDYPIIGYNNNTVNTLRLWDAQPKDSFDLESFNEGNYTKAVEQQNLANMLCEVLYPADDKMQGKELRLKQQYFFISATLQRVLVRFHSKHKDFSLMPDYVRFQMNDTHPTVAVPELMRLLMDRYDLSWEEAWDVTTRCCAYTNHTIMSEALEKWPIELFSRLLPRVYMIIEEINRRFCVQLIDRYGNDPDKIRKMAIVADGQIRMAHLAIVGGHSVNGVAALHTEILKKQELKDFYEFYPEKFNNKTNGITQRRWLAYCNPALARLITNTIGSKWMTELDELRNLVPYASDSSFREQFMKIKRNNKVALSNMIWDKNGVLVDPDSMFDIQVKRLHEYKRQLLNILHVLHLYNKLKVSHDMDFPPRTFVFSGKSAASYHRAKLIIKLINNVANVINGDASIGGRLKVIFMENYRVSLAERLVPACDLSEQISTAGKEASGTGNMKFMLNGAITIGTMDGANVEIFEEVGKDNIFIFGLSDDEAAKLSCGTYDPWDVYNLNQDIRMVMTQLINGSLSDDHELFRDLYECLLNGRGGRADEYLVLKDFESYAETQSLVSEKFKDKSAWARSAIMNTSKAGKFSSDRTIKQYAEEIWGLKPIKI